MSIALSMPLMLSAVRALMRYRDRVDRVLSLSTATEGLPFVLPGVPQDMMPFREEMRAFFRTEEGRTILVVHGFEESFKAWDSQLLAGKDITMPSLQDNFDKCMEVYRRACNIGPFLLQPEVRDPKMLSGYAASGPGDDSRLAYFIVDSDRVSRNPAVTRILLITADTLLEFLGENASSFISGTRTRTVVESLIEEFAGKQDFDDQSAQDIFRSLLSAGVTAVLDHTEVLPNKPLLVALYGAINDVRREVKAKAGGNDTRAYDTLSRVFGEGGLERIGRSFLLRVGNDPSLVADGSTARAAVKATLSEIVAAYDTSGSFRDLLKSPATANRVLEAVVDVGLGPAADTLKRKAADGKPFAAVLLALVENVDKAAGDHSLIKSIAAGEIVGDLYAVALAAVANNPGMLSDKEKVPPFVEDLVKAIAEGLQKARLPEGTNSMRDELISAALKVLVKHPAVLSGSHKYASAVVAATLGAAVQGAEDGFSKQDLESVLDAALRAAGDNASLAGMNQAQAAGFKAITDELADASLASLRSAAARKDLLFSVLAAINANPKIWEDEAARQQLQPLIAAVIAVLKEGRTRRLLSDSATLAAFDAILKAASQRGKSLLAGAAAKAIEGLRDLLLKNLLLAEQELGRLLDQEAIPDLLGQVALAYCRAPFALTQQAIDKLFKDICARLDQL